MSVLAALSSHTDAAVHHFPPPRYHHSNSSLSDFSIDALISADLTRLRRRSPPPTAGVWTPHVAVGCGETAVNTPPPTPPSRPRPAASVTAARQLNMATTSRQLLIPVTFPLNSFTAGRYYSSLLSSLLVIASGQSNLA